MSSPWTGFDGPSGHFHDFTGPKASCAYPDLADTRSRLGLYALEVRFPFLGRGLVRMADAVPEDGPFSANLAYFRHVQFSLWLIGSSFIPQNPGPSKSPGPGSGSFSLRTRALAVPGLSMEALKGPFPFYEHIDIYIVFFLLHDLHKLSFGPPHAFVFPFFRSDILLKKACIRDA